MDKYARRGFGAVFFELCKHTPRCDVVFDAAYATVINRLVKNLQSPRYRRPGTGAAYDDTFVPYPEQHTDLPRMLAACEATLRALVTTRALNKKQINKK